MDALFDGVALFGTPTRSNGPTGPYRSTRETLPGVGGYAIYRMGAGPLTWTIRGRLTASTLSAVKDLLWEGVQYIDGNIYDYRDTDNRLYPNCELTAFAPAGDFVGCTLANGTSAVTVEISATVNQASP